MLNIPGKLAAVAALTVFLAPIGALAVDVDMDAGTLISGHVEREISSKTAQDGDRFAVRTDAGSVIFGHVSQVSRANVGRKAHLALNFDRIRFSDGTSAPIRAKLVSVEKKAKTNYVRAAGTVLGGMIAGNILGKALGTNAGGALGVVGGGLLAANTASDIDVPQGSAVEVQLTEPLVLRRQAH
jgi:hypothetical protein